MVVKSLGRGCEGNTQFRVSQTPAADHRFKAQQFKDVQPRCKSCPETISYLLVLSDYLWGCSGQINVSWKNLP